MSDVKSTDNWVALLRGVNVGGGNKVPMADLRALCEGLGWQDVQSYIASGNLVFRTNGAAEGLADTLRGVMSQKMGVDVPVLVLSAEAVAQALADCPFQPEKGNLCHVFFLWADPVMDWEAYETYRIESEELAVQGKVAWLHTPEGFGRSKLAEKLGKVITDTDMTGRNLNTLHKLVEMSN